MTLGFEFHVMGSLYLTLFLRRLLCMIPYLRLKLYNYCQCYKFRVELSVPRVTCYDTPDLIHYQAVVDVTQQLPFYKFNNV